MNKLYYYTRIYTIIIYIYTILYIYNIFNIYNIYAYIYNNIYNIYYIYYIYIYYIIYIYIQYWINILAKNTNIIEPLISLNNEFEVTKNREGLHTKLESIWQKIKFWTTIFRELTTWQMSPTMASWSQVNLSRRNCRHSPHCVAMTRKHHEPV